MEKSTHTINILKDLIKGKTLISSDIRASNSNQYFNNIKNKGIELIEEVKPIEGRHKQRRLKLNEENLKRANNYLSSLLGKNLTAGA